MSEKIEDLSDVEALKARVQELEVEVASLREENEKLKDALTKAGDALQQEIDKQREALVASITAATEMSEDELKDLNLKQLKLIHKAVSSVKIGDKDEKEATVKTVRVSATRNENPLTVGCLYHKPQEGED